MASKATEHLRLEHETMRRVLASFDAFLARVEAVGPSERKELAGLIDYVSECLFIKHEEKEESVLSAELFRLGMSWSDGPLAHVRQQHRHGRYLTRSLRQLTQPTRDWDRGDLDHFRQLGREWAEFLREHMNREEREIFPYLEKRLEEAQDERLAGQFMDIDRDYDGMRDVHQLRAAGEAFLEKYEGR